MTSPRWQVIEHVAARDEENFTAEQLAAELTPVGRATVYRTLPLLVECGVLRELDFGKDYKFYDPNYIDHPGHNHLICLDCSKVVEFEDRNIDTLEDCITKRLGFSPENKILRIEAKCDELKLKGACSHRKQ